MTNAELAILTLVAERPRHGYEIERVIEERGMREWTEIGFSSIYYLLKKLEREGLIKGQLEAASRGAARRVFHLTSAGREAARVGVIEALSVPHHCYPPLQLGLANLSGIPPTEAVAALREHRETLGEQLAQLQARQEGQQPLPSFVDAMFDYSATMIQAEKGWIERFIAQLERQEDENDQG